MGYHRSVCFCIIGAKQEVIVWLLRLGNSHFRGSVLRQLMIVLIQMIRGYIDENGYFRTKGIAIVQLKTADFQNVQGFRMARYLESKACADVSTQSYVLPRLAENVKEQRGCGGLAIASCDREYGRIGVVKGKFNFRPNRNCFFCDFFEER